MPCDEKNKSVPVFEHINHAYLYNSPGNRSSILSIAQTLGWVKSPDPEKITEIQADAGLSPISESGSNFSAPIWLHVEDQTLGDVSNPPGSRNHSQRVLTDTLAVYNLYHSISNTLSINEIESIVKASSMDNALTLESAVERVGRVFYPNITSIPEGNREKVYENIYSIERHVRQLESDFTIVSLENVSDLQNIVLNAKSNIAHCYTLVNLNPFVVLCEEGFYVPNEQLICHGFPVFSVQQYEMRIGL